MFFLFYSPRQVVLAESKDFITDNEACIISPCVYAGLGDDDDKEKYCSFLS